MAYISKEKVAEMRKKIRKEFPNFKISVRRLHYFEVWVNIYEGDADFVKEYKYNDELSENLKNNFTMQINEYHIDDNFSGRSKEVLNKIKEIITTTEKHYDSNFGDYGADYCDFTFYYTIEIGSYDRPYQIKKEEVTV